MALLTSAITKKNKKIYFKFPEESDVESLTKYFNDLSSEDTFVYFAQRCIKKEHVLYYLQNKIKRLEQRTGVHMLCVYDDTIVGNCHIEKDAMKETRAGHVASLGLSVHKNYREEGIGKLLLLETVEQAKRLLPEVQIIRLEVFANNSVAQNLYKKLGFIETGRIPRGIFYKNEYIDEITMCLRLG